MDENEVLNMSKSWETEDATNNGKVTPIYIGVLDCILCNCIFSYSQILWNLIKSSTSSKGLWATEWNLIVIYNMTMEF